MRQNVKLENNNTVALNTAFPSLFLPVLSLPLAQSAQKFTSVEWLCTHCGVWMHINHSLPSTQNPTNQGHYYRRHTTDSQNICHAAVGTSLLSSWRDSESLPHFLPWCHIHPCPEEQGQNKLVLLPRVTLNSFAVFVLLSKPLLHGLCTRQL